MKKYIALIIVIIILPMYLNAKIIGYRDRDKNKVNDLFRDANGNGINDITGKKYKHRFPFIDKNKDGINDVFVDKNGDGFNDAKNSFYRKLFQCIDFNRDGINDITGKRYKSISKSAKILVKARRFANIKHNGGKKIKTNPKKEKVKRVLNPSGKNKYDTFIDKNNNGIDDRRESKKTVVIKKKKSDGEK